MREYFSFILDFCDIAVIVLPKEFSLKVVNVYPVVPERRRACPSLYKFLWPTFTRYTRDFYLPRWINTECIRYPYLRRSVNWSLMQDSRSFICSSIPKSRASKHKPLQRSSLSKLDKLKREKRHKRIFAGLTL